jgi:hypothetical protein
MTDQAELIARIARAVAEADANDGAKRLLLNSPAYMAVATRIATSLLPFLTAERELGRVEGARAGINSCAERLIKGGMVAHADDLRASIDPAEIVKEIGNG